MVKVMGYYICGYCFCKMEQWTEIREIWYRNAILYKLCIVVTVCSPIIHVSASPICALSFIASPCGGPRLPIMRIYDILLSIRISVLSSVLCFEGSTRNIALLLRSFGGLYRRIDRYLTLRLARKSFDWIFSSVMLQSAHFEIRDRDTRKSTIYGRSSSGRGMESSNLTAQGTR